MKALQQAARAALERDFEGRASAAPAPIERLTLGVAGQHGQELVSLRLHGAALSWSCTCGVARCEHGHAALSALAEGSGATRSSVPPPAPSRSSEPPPPRRTQSSDRHELALELERRAAPTAEARPQDDRASLAESLDDVLISIARSGVAAGRSASVDDALARLRRAAPVPCPLALERWLGRLEHALAANDADQVAPLLAGAGALADALRAPEAATREQHACIRAWLASGSAHDGPRLTDRSLVEIAREQLAGATRGAIERRYLVDLETGHVYREERVPGGEPTSLGPCPRLLAVSLATLEAGPPPARVHVLQYTATLEIDDQVWEKLAGYAERDFAALAARYRAELGPFPGSCEPFALVAPAGNATRGQTVLLDGAGHALALAEPDGGHALRALGDDGELLWACGRLCDQRGALALRLAGAALKRDGRVQYVQL